MIKLREYYNSLALPARAAMWFAFAQFFQKGITMLTTPVFTRLLSTAEYGRANTFMSWAELLVILISLSVWRGILNLYKENDNKDEIVSSVIGLTLLVSIIVTILMVSCYYFLNKIIGLSPLLYLSLILYAISQNIVYAWMVRMQYDYRYKPIIAYAISYTAITAFGGAGAVLLVSKTAESKILPQVIVITIFSLIIVIKCFRKFGHIYDKKVWTFCLGFAIPLIPHYLSEVVLHSSDRIMINNMCGSSEVAIYSIAYAVGSLVLMVTGAINSAFAPYQYQKISNKEYSTLSHNTNIIIGFVALCAILLMLFSREIVLIFGGEKYLDSIKLIMPITVGVFFNYVFQLFARVQEYFEQKNTIVIASISCAILNLVLNYIFIPIFGFAAAAYTTVFCYFTFCMVHYKFYIMACKKNIGKTIYDIKGLIIISAIVAGAACLVSFVDELPFIKYAILMLLIFIGCLKRKTIIGYIIRIRGK